MSTEDSPAAITRCAATAGRVVYGSQCQNLMQCLPGPPMATWVCLASQSEKERATRSTGQGRVAAANQSELANATLFCLVPPASSRIDGVQLGVWALWNARSRLGGHDEASAHRQLNASTGLRWLDRLLPGDDAAAALFSASDHRRAGADWLCPPRPRPARHTSSQDFLRHEPQPTAPALGLARCLGRCQWPGRRSCAWHSCIHLAPPLKS